MTRTLAVAIVLWAAGTAQGGALPSPVAGAKTDRPWWAAPFAPQPQHPAVVRVVVPERDGFSLGSGALVAASAEHGLVVTNWHVVRDATGPVTVVFPDGFRSGATVLKTDHDWDLAALAIWRPAAQPIPLAGQAPRHGEPLTIIGYGGGQYRAATGRCVQYLSPGPGQPAELVELSTAARQGDSGGPILNSRGELAGVLFGASPGRTAGSHCGRVRAFLASVTSEFQEAPPDGTMIARRPPPCLPAPAAARQASAPLAAPSIPSHAAGPRSGAAEGPRARAREGEWTASIAAAPGDSPETAAPQPGHPPQAASDWASQIKTLLALVGVIAILLQGVKLLGTEGPPAGKPLGQAASSRRSGSPA